MSTHKPPKRPWYCNNSLVDSYLARAESGDDLAMMKTVRAFESLVVNVGIIAITSFAIHNGEANAYVVLAAIITLGLLNGLLVADYKAIARALAELTNAQTDQSRDDDRED